MTATTAHSHCQHTLFCTAHTHTMSTQTMATPMNYDQIHKFAESLLSGEWVTMLTHCTHNQQDKELDRRFSPNRRRPHSVRFASSPIVFDYEKQTPVVQSTQQTQSTARQQSQQSTARQESTTRQQSSARQDATRRRSFSIAELLALERQKKQALEQGQKPPPTSDIVAKFAPQPVQDTKTLQEEPQDSDRPPTPPLEELKTIEEEKQKAIEIPKQKLMEGSSSVEKDLNAIKSMLVEGLPSLFLLTSIRELGSNRKPGTSNRKDSDSANHIIH